MQQVHENKYYADLAGTRTTQQRIRLLPTFTAMGADDERGVFDDMSSIAPPAGRGWEYSSAHRRRRLGLGRRARRGARAARREAGRARASRPARYDLVIHPSNLWLTIHESIGHATELDRALGYEANYAGTSFATFDKLGTLQYGSPVMHVTGDRTVEHGLATDRVRRRGGRRPSAGTSSATASWSATSSTGRWRTCSRS